MTRLATEAAPDLWSAIDQGVAREGDFAVREHLSSGFPVYYREADTPVGLLVKEHPGGRRELVRHKREADEIIRAL